MDTKTVRWQPGVLLCVYQVSGGVPKSFYFFYLIPSLNFFFFFTQIQVYPVLTSRKQRTYVNSALSDFCPIVCGVACSRPSVGGAVRRAAGERGKNDEGLGTKPRSLSPWLAWFFLSPMFSLATTNESLNMWMNVWCPSRIHCWTPIIPDLYKRSS